MPPPRTMSPWSRYVAPCRRRGRLADGAAVLRGVNAFLIRGAGGLFLSSLCAGWLRFVRAGQRAAGDACQVRQMASSNLLRSALAASRAICRRRSGERFSARLHPPFAPIRVVCVQLLTRDFRSCSHRLPSYLHISLMPRGEGAERQRKRGRFLPLIGAPEPHDRHTHIT